MNDLPTRRAFNRHGARELERTIDEAMRELEAQKLAGLEAAKARRAAERELRGTITHAGLAGAISAAPSGVAVRDDTGWHVLLHLNAKSVTVPGPWGGTRLIPINRLLEVRS